MAYDLYLSYTGRKTYLDCPRKYWFRYVKKEVAHDDPKNTLFGIIIGKIFELFYNNKLWSLKDPVSECLKIVNKVVSDSCDEKNFNPLINEDFVSNLKNDVTKFIPTTVNTIREHKLLKPKSRSEVDLSVEYRSKSHGISLKIAGRSDFIHEPDSIWIIDGKGSVHRERYVDSEQLIWYAVQYYLKYHVAPDRLGFLYYRFPENPIQWIVYDENSMRSNLLKTFDTAVKILNKEFDAIPSVNCNRCEFSKFCDEGHKFLAAKRASNIIVVPDSTFGFDDVIS